MFTETRPGEKLTESLVTPREEVVPTPHSFIFRLTSRNGMSREALLEQTGELISLAAFEREDELAGRRLDKEI